MTGISDWQMNAMMWQAQAKELSEKLEQALAERDEARRWCCELWATDQIISQNTGMTPADYAAETGWDCFKEKP
jgi:hypothetical protein